MNQLWKILKKINQKNKDGFSLIEMAVVVFIILTLTGLLAPRLASLQIKTKESATIQNAKFLEQKLQMYQIENNRYPSSDYISELLKSSGPLEKYSSNTKINDILNKNPFTNAPYNNSSMDSQGQIFIKTSTDGHEYFLTAKGRIEPGNTTPNIIYQHYQADSTAASNTATFPDPPSI